ncbi:plasmid mobilization relaxosome protein MobC [Aliivibrio fischeri]|uniref:plasmid mobilization protein n=1 Tax=Aliivibrio fischeri TaxID=668 RepID=UPI0012D92BAA|nr:plasmid mobilization relaxosome protein MobC [Aliivibrio fischeri]MUK76554.1 plasmid mobilization relaxosome protein MobC [Aliivibrio fischeri]
MSKKKSLTTTYVGFRLLNEEHDKFTKKAEKANMTLIEFLREGILKNKSIVVRKEDDSLDKQQLIFLYRKTSNNLNQLTKQVHISNKAGTLSKANMDKAIHQLESIKALLEKGINHVN